MRRRNAACVAAVTMLVIGACSGGDGEPTGLATDDLATTGAPTDSPTGDPSSDPTPADQPTGTAEASPTEDPDVDPTSDEAVIADYRAARDAYIAAYDPPDPENAGLIEWHDEYALERYQGELEDLAAEGHAEVIEYDLHPDVRVSGSRALINDCYDVTVTTTDTETGEPVGEVQTYTRNTDFSLELREDKWVIVNYNHVESECTPGG